MDEFEEVDFVDDEGFVEDEPQYVSSYQDIERVAGFGAAFNLDGTQIKVQKTAYDHYMDDIKSKLFSDYDNILNAEQMTYIIDKIGQIEHVELYNGYTLIAAFAWKVTGFSDKEYKKFYKDLTSPERALSEPLDKIDLWRYIRKFG